jgi:hypothetical protein
VVRAVAGRAVPVAVGALHARQKTVERRHQVVVRARADLDDDESRRGMWDEDREEAVAQAVLGRLGDERLAGTSEVMQPAAAPRPDRQLARLYGKMLRIASRSRPSPPPTGADS